MHGIDYWKNLKPTIEQELLDKLRQPDNYGKSFDVLVDVLLGCPPLIERGGAVFNGATTGLSFHLGPISIDVGYVRGKDSKELNP